MDITTAQLIRILDHVGATLDAQVDALNDLDGVIGDADHGTALHIGWTAVRKALAEMDESAKPADVFTAVAKAFLSAVGGSAGALYATAFMRAAAAVKDKPALDREAFLNWLAAAARGVRDRGGAELGDKTMVDAWVPAIESLEQTAADDRPLIDCLEAAAAGAARGRDSTIDMVGGKGKSGKLGDRARGHVDPGAASTAIFFQALADAVARTG